MGIVDVARMARDFSELSRFRARLIAFAHHIDSIMPEYRLGTLSVYELYETIIRHTNLLEAISAEKDSTRSRIKDIEEFGNSIERYEEEMG
jgi:hypothetical protein